MDDERRTALTDDMIEREIERALDIAPGPAFLAEVRARVAQESSTSHWRRHWMVLATSAVVLTIAAGGAVSWFRMTPGPELIPRPMPSTSTGLVEASLRVTPLKPTPTPRPQRLASTNTRPARHQTASPRVDILISQAEATALRRFLDEATRRPLSIVVEEAAGADAMPSAFGSAEIVISPIVIVPLDTASTEGVKP